MSLAEDVCTCISMQFCLKCYWELLIIFSVMLTICIISTKKFASLKKESKGHFLIQVSVMKKLYKTHHMVDQVTQVNKEPAFLIVTLTLG